MVLPRGDHSTPLDDALVVFGRLVLVALHLTRLGGIASLDGSASGLAANRPIQMLPFGFVRWWFWSPFFDAHLLALSWCETVLRLWKRTNRDTVSVACGEANPRITPANWGQSV